MTRTSARHAGAAKLDLLAEAHMEEITHLAPTMRTLWRALQTLRLFGSGVRLIRPSRSARSTSPSALWCRSTRESASWLDIVPGTLSRAEDAGGPIIRSDEATRRSRECSGERSARSVLLASGRGRALPSWCGEFIREVTDIERDRDGLPRRAHVRVHVAQSLFREGPRVRRGDSDRPTGWGALSRLPSGTSDLERLTLSWSLVEGDGTWIRLGFSAGVSFLPRLVPLPGVGDLIARTLLDSAVHALGGSVAPAGRAPSSGQ